jgi:hypothetical protein
MRSTGTTGTTPGTPAARVTRPRTGRPPLVIVIAMCAAVLAGCAGGGDPGPDPTAAPGRASTAPAGPSGPVVPRPPRPGGPPKTPSDLVPTDRFAGRVVRGGDGPCYGVATDEGETYALYSRTAYTLRVGDTVLVTFEPLRLKIDCGDGRPVSVVELTIVR